MHYIKSKRFNDIRQNHACISHEPLTHMHTQPLLFVAVEVQAAQGKVKLLADTGFICFLNHL